MKDGVWLKELLHEEPLPDHGFTARVSDRLTRRRRNLGLAKLAALIVASVCLVFGLTVTFGPLPEAQNLDPRPFVALLIGLACCAALWLDTEPACLWH